MSTFNEFLAGFKLRIANRADLSSLQKAKALRRLWNRYKDDPIFDDTSYEKDEDERKEQEQETDTVDEIDLDRERQIIHIMRKYNDMPDVFDTTEQGTQDINERGEFGRTLLHRAVMADDEDTIIKLLELGADIHIMDNNNHTPYLMAVIHKKHDIAQLLSEYCRAPCRITKP